MAKTKTAADNKGKKKGEQLDLIDVAPKNAKPIIAKAREYKKVMKVRLSALAKETQLKEEIKDLIHKAKLKPINKEGVVRFKYDGVTVSLVPVIADEKVKVDFDKDK